MTYAYDEVNLPVEVTGPDGATIKLAYDDDNRRVETAFPGGVTQSEERDDDGLLTRIAAEDAAGVALTDLAYDHTTRVSL